LYSFWLKPIKPVQVGHFYWCEPAKLVKNCHFYDHKSKTLRLAVTFEFTAVKSRNGCRSNKSRKHLASLQLQELFYGLITQIFTVFTALLVFTA
jgi:hypothetical protein